MPAPARLAALRASAPRLTATVLTAAHHAIQSATRAIQSATRAVRAGATPVGLATRAVRAGATPVGQAARTTAAPVSEAAARALRAVRASAAPVGRRAVSAVTPAALTCASAVRTAVAPMGQAVSRAAGRAVVPAALTAATSIRAGAARLTGALPPRAKVPAAAATVIAMASAVTAAAVAVGPTAAAGPAGPAIAAAALHPASAGTPGHAVTRHLAPAVAAAAGPRHRVATSVRHHHPAAKAGGRGVVARRHHQGRRRRGRARVVASTWHAITEAAAGRPGGGRLRAAQRLLPAPLTGGQAALPLTPARAANAALITRQALRLHMGLRAAVIAVATAMQESTLENLAYGDRDSLGLFQQRPSAGWGTPAQITTPAYAADAFYHALASYQAAHPRWATDPLYQAAQGVQRSAFPYAYAQWEDQAAHIVAAAARHLL